MSVWNTAVMRQIALTLLTAMALAVQAFALVSAQTAPGQGVQGQAVPGTKRDLDFDEFMTGVDLEAPNLVFIYKGRKQEGSSVGFHVADPGRRKTGTFVPVNSSSNPEAEVVSYRLARFLGVSHLYNPVTYYQLGPLAVARFRTLLRNNPETTEDRVKNKVRVVAELTANPTSEFGIYRLRPDGKLFHANALGMNGNPALSHPLLQAIRADRPMPGTATMSLPGVKGQRRAYPSEPMETQLELARQLSSILVVDQLLGQWDRFWRNLEASGDAAGRLSLMARDNGGATIEDGWEWHPRYESMTSRYDRAMMNKLQSLHAFLNAKAPAFGDFKSVEAWKTAVGFRKASSYGNFKKKLDMLIGKTLPTREKQFGEKVYFSSL
jgi:hypothetical protein